MAIAARRAILSILLACGLAQPADAAFDAGITDLDGDGRSDILWRNAQTGQVFRLAVDGLSVVAGGVVHSEPDTRWKVVGDGDFDGDGRSDLVWRHDADGRIYIMVMGAGGVPSGGTVVHVEPDMRWHIVATADLDGDGRADLVWWNETTGLVYAMLMNGPAIASQGPVYAEPNVQWRIVGGDAGTLFWHNQSTGQVFRQLLVRSGNAWSLAGAVIYAEPDTAWRIVGVGDLDGNGTPDLVWRNGGTGQVYGLLLSGAGVTGGGMIHTEPNGDWQVVALGDYDGDGRSDLLWRNFATGQVFGMRMSGVSVAARAAVYTEADPHWRILGAHDYSWDDRLEGNYLADAIATISSTRTVDPDCMSADKINCPNGVPTPTTVTYAVQSSTVVGSDAAIVLAVHGSYHVVVPLAGTCLLTFNSIGGAAAHWTFHGRASASNSWGGSFPMNRFEFQNPTFTGIESADIALSGGFGCSLASVSISFFLSTLADQFADSFARYCGAPGPQKFTKCPAP